MPVLRMRLGARNRGRGKVAFAVGALASAPCAALGQGQPTFNFVASAFPHSVYWPFVYELADINADGRTDVFWASGGNDHRVLAYIARETASPQWVELPMASNVYPRHTLPVDFDGDGDLDIVTVSGVTVTPLGQNFKWFENPGSLLQTWTRRDVEDFHSVARLTPGDFNNDGRVDFAGYQSNVSHVRVAVHDGGDPPALLVSLLPGGDNLVHVRALDVGDLDGDGDDDIVRIDRGEVRWLRSDGAANPAFTSILLGEAPGSTGDTRDIKVGDIDGDGDLDVVTSQSAHSRILFWENDGAADPTFTKHVVTDDPDGIYNGEDPIGEGVYAIELADINGNGRVDIVAASVIDDRVVGWANDGATPPGFVPKIIFQSSYNLLQKLRAGDIDNDGDTDLLLGGYQDSNVVWLENRTPACAADFIVDGFVNGPDLAMMLAAWGTSSPMVDLNSDGVVDGLDLASLLALWGGCL